MRTRKLCQSGRIMALVQAGIADTHQFEAGHCVVTRVNADGAARAAGMRVSGRRPACHLYCLFGSSCERIPWSCRCWTQTLHSTGDRDTHSGANSATSAGWRRDCGSGRYADGWRTGRALYPRVRCVYTTVLHACACTPCDIPKETTKETSPTTTQNYASQNFV